MKSLILIFLFFSAASRSECLGSSLKNESILKQMTLEEKVLLLSGSGWHTQAIARLGIPAVTMSDGPHGLRKPMGMEFGQSVPSTAFPTLSALGATWNKDLLRRIGRALGEEAQANDVQILLGPAINMKRSPLAGRNFEYLSEDPVLTGVLAASYVDGLQSEGVGACLKHFAANNQEFERMSTSSNIDEQTLRELYLAAFERVVRGAHPWAVMSAYNKINGVLASENTFLLKDILRNEWGFGGIVISDWGAISDRIKSLEAGTNLEMPESGEYRRKNLISALKTGKLSEATLNEAVDQLLTVIQKAHQSRKSGARFSAEQHQALAREAAGEAIVLLKNDRRLLPLNFSKLKRIAVIGAFAKTPRYQGVGSAQVTPILMTNALEELSKIAGTQTQIVYAPGYDVDTGEVTDEALSSAMRAATTSDVAIVFAGLPDSFESEGTDRSSLSLPKGHTRLIEAVAGVKKKTIVVLSNGSAVEMPWSRKVKAIVETWLTGQAGGAAIADVLSGKVNPSGKTSESFPAKLSDVTVAGDFPAKDGQADYREGLFTGYRHFDHAEVTALFPFGFGLSYTDFDYSRLRVENNSRSAEVHVEVDVRNAGPRAGKEVVQLYVGEPSSSSRPVKTLRAFDKIELQAGEKKTVRFKLEPRDFSQYDRTTRSWILRGGEYAVMVGGSSAKLPMRKTVNLKSGVARLTRQSTVKNFRDHPIARISYSRLAKALGLDLEELLRPPAAGASAEQIRVQKRGLEAFQAFVNDTPIEKIPALSQGAFTDDMVDDVLKNQ